MEGSGLKSAEEGLKGEEMTRGEKKRTGGTEGNWGRGEEDRKGSGKTKATQIRCFPFLFLLLCPLTLLTFFFRNCGFLSEHSDACL